MFNDPEIMKLIIYALLGIIAVLGIALIVVGVKRNTYYVDEEGEEVAPPAKRRKKEPVVEEPEEPVVVKPAQKPASKPEPKPTKPVEPVKPVVEAVVTPSVEPKQEKIDPLSETIVVDKQDLHAIPTPIVNKASEGAKTVEVPVSGRKEAPKGFKATVAINGNTTEHTIEKLPCLIGRDKESCDLVVSERAVSRKHAKIYFEDGTLYLADVAEHNGTYLNGRKLPPLGNAPLHENDKINLGRAVLVIDKILY